MGLSRSFGIARGLGWLAAIRSMVFPSGHADFTCWRTSSLFPSHSSFSPLRCFRFFPRRYCPGLLSIFNNANWALATLVIGVVHLFAQIPGGHFYVEHPHWPENLIAKITVLDLGAGAAVHLQTGGTDWLFDCGSERSYQRVVREYLHWAGVNRLSGLLLTHGDALHLGGTEQLLDDFPRIACGG